MRFRHLVLGICLMTTALAFPDQQKEDWLPVMPADLQVKEVPGNHGASAIQLYYANDIDDNGEWEFVYRRIKILTEAGRKYADVEIPTSIGVEIKDLKARTIHPDGSIVDFSGKPFEKTLFKGWGIKVIEKTFTLPEVTPGCIIEYKYKMMFENARGFSTDNWILQHDLFTVRQRFSFAPNERISGRIAWVTLHLKDITPTKTHGDKAELEMHDVVPFESEGYMPPEGNYKPSVHFFYIPSDVSTADKYWEMISRDFYEAIEAFIGNHKEVREAAAQAIGGETDPEKKLRKLYERAQQVRNLSYERGRSEAELKKEKIKNNEGVAEVLKRGYGDGWDIARLFVGMARAAGFDASILMVSNRQQSFFSKEVLTWTQLDSEIADVKLNGVDVYLDPGTKYCPYGFLRWMRMSTVALKPEKRGVNFITVPAFTQEKAVTRRRADVSISEDGSLKGEVLVQFQGLEALEHRLDAINTDEAGRNKDLEQELQTWLPSAAVVKLLAVQGWDSPGEPLTARFSVEIPAYATLAGKRFLMPAYLFQVKQKEAFSHPDRKYPLYFPYAFAQVDVVNYRVPAGFSTENIPQQQDAELPYARYQSKFQFKDGLLTTQRALLLNGIYFGVDKYPEVKAFFSKVQTGDEQQAVLRSGGNVDAQKNN